MQTHMADLVRSNILDGEWNPLPPINISKKADFVSKLLKRYVDDLAQRRMIQEQPD